jgi:hypothetical protein
MHPDELPIVCLDDPSELKWETFLSWCQRVLAILGALFLLAVVFAFAGYWYAKTEHIKPSVETPCGSCKIQQPKGNK